MKLRAIFVSVMISTLTTMLFAQGQKFHVLIGNNAGIHVYEFNSQTGEMNFKTRNIENSAGYFTVSSDRRHIYSASSAATISAFRYDPASGNLTFLNKQPTGGGGSAYVSTDDSGKYVFSASYGGGSLSALPVESDGSLGPDVQVIKHEGRSVDTSRQTRSYVHSIVVSPDNRYVITADLGTDRMNIYRFDPNKRPAPLAPAVQPFFKLEPGSGPRHSTFHPNKNFYYVVNELNSTIDGFHYKDGHLTHIQTVKMLDKDYTGKGDAADIHVSPDGKFLYGNTRNNANEVVAYSIDQNSGKLTFLGRQSSLGKGSRTFDIHPTGDFMVVTNQASNTVVVFKRDQKTGLLTATEHKVDLERPSSVKFVRTN